VELYNRGATTVDLSDWAFTDGIAYVFPSNTYLDPNEYLVVAGDPNAMFLRKGITAEGPFTGKLDDGGERITLTDNAGLLVDTVRYDDDHPWPMAPDEYGYSLECIDPFSDNSTAANWRPSQTSLVAPPGTLENRIDIQNVWSYDDTGADLGTAWREPAYNDSAWPTGTAPP